MLFARLRLCRFGLVGCAVALVAACASEVPLGRPDVLANDVEAQAASIRAPATTRAMVHEALGEPWVSTDRGDAEVFRTSGRQHRMLLVFAPYPVPLPLPGERLDGYTLVSYYDDGLVAAVDSGFTRSESFGRTHHLVLGAGDYEFLHGTRETLSVALGNLERYLSARAPGSTCTVIVGCEHATGAVPPASTEGSVCFTRVEIDGRKAIDLPLVQLAIWPRPHLAPGAAPPPDPECSEAGGRTVDSICLVERRLLYPLLLEPGQHSLRFTNRELEGHASSAFECVAGRTVFATLRGERTGSYSMSKQLSSRLKVGAATGTLTFSDAAPEGIRSQKVILHVDGAYLLRRQAQP